MFRGLFFGRRMISSNVRAVMIQSRMFCNSKTHSSTLNPYIGHGLLFGASLVPLYGVYYGLNTAFSNRQVRRAVIAFSVASIFIVGVGFGYVMVAQHFPTHVKQYADTSQYILTPTILGSVGYIIWGENGAGNQLGLGEILKRMCLLLC